MWFKLDSDRTSISLCEHFGSMLKLHQILVKIKQLNAIFDWMHLPQFQQHNQDLALVTLKLIVLHQVQFIPHQYSLNGANLRIFCSVFLTWSDWSSCSVTCGSGDQTRSRTCDQNCASVSSGDLVESQSCNDAGCPAFSTWSDWYSCSVTCGYGDQTRSRTCDQNCASVSSDDLVESQSCNEADCPLGK